MGGHVSGELMLVGLHLDTAVCLPLRFDKSVRSPDVGCKSPLNWQWLIYLTVFLREQVGGAEKGAPTPHSRAYNSLSPKEL